MNRRPVHGPGLVRASESAEDRPRPDEDGALQVPTSPAAGDSEASGAVAAAAAEASAEAEATPADENAGKIASD